MSGSHAKPGGFFPEVRFVISFHPQSGYRTQNDQRGIPVASHRCLRQVFTSKEEVVIHYSNMGWTRCMWLLSLGGEPWGLIDCYTQFLLQVHSCHRYLKYPETLIRQERLLGGYQVTSSDFTSCDFWYSLFRVSYAVSVYTFAASVGGLVGSRYAKFCKIASPQN